MPNISNKESHQFWFDYHDKMIYRVIAFLESVEDWTLDGESNLEVALTKLGDALENVGNIDLREEDNFIELLAYVKAGRMLRIMQALDTAHPGAASKLLMHAEKQSKSVDDAPGLFLRRNVVFERLRLLGRVFSDERFSLVQNALEEID